MRIAIYSGQIPGTTFIERLVQGLAQRGHTVLLFGNKERAVSYPANVEVYAVPSGKLNMLLYVFIYLIRLLFTNPSSIGKLLSLVKGYEGDKFRYLVKILPVFLHRPDVFHIQWAKSLKDWAWVKQLDIKLVVSLRGSHINYSPLADEKLVAAYRKYFPIVDAFHAVSQDMGRKAKAYGAHHIKTIYSGLDLNGLNQQKEPTTNKRFEIVSVGRWHWTKGITYAIDAMHMLKNAGANVHYTIVAGKSTEEAIYHIASMGLESIITVEKEMPHSAVLQKMKEADLLLLPSVSEGLANVVLEAMAVGTPVLSTNCGGMDEVILDGENGFLVPVRDSLAIAERILHIMQLKENELERITAAARQTVIAQHDIEKMTDEFVSLYEEVMTGK